MTSPVIHEVIKTYDKLFQFGKRISIWMDPNTQLMSLETRKWKLLPWYLNISVLLVTLLIVIYIIVRQLFASTVLVPRWILLLNIMFAFIGSMIFSGSVGVIYYGRNIASSWNKILEISRSQEARSLGRTFYIICNL